MKKNFPLFLFVTVVVVASVGIYGFTNTQLLNELALVSCTPGQFCGSSVTPTTVGTGGSYTIGCNYGYTGNGIRPLPGSGSCTFSKFSGTTALFNCTAGNTFGTYGNSCSLDSGSPYGQKTNAIASTVVHCGAGQFCGGTVAPTSVTAGGAYNMSCNYGYTGDGINPNPGSGSCKFSSFSGTTAQFNCTAGSVAGTFNNSCSLDSSSPYPVKTNAVNALAVTAPVVPQVVIPSNAISSGDLNGNSLWKWTHDFGTSGASTGNSTYPLSIGGYSDVREYEISNYSGYGGERYSINFVNDTATTHFIYDVYVQSPNPSVIGNLELDMNQVTTNGYTVIFAFQCDSAKGVWDYAKVTDPNGGASGTAWVPSKIACNVSQWTPNKWYHIQISTQRDNSGNVTYNWVAVNGVLSPIGVTTFQQQALGWKIGSIVVNFQLDPRYSTGNPLIVYAHNLTIYRW